MMLLLKEVGPKAGDAWDDDDKTFMEVCTWGGGDDIKKLVWFLFNETFTVVAGPLDCDGWGKMEDDDDDDEDMESEL